MCYMKTVIYSMTNSAENNQIVALTSNMDGTLSFANAYYTGGAGTGAQVTDPLTSQGSIILSSDRHFLYCVNAGSNTISSFSVCANGKLYLMDTVCSGGIMPVSLASFGNTLYVANSGDANCHVASNIVSFEVNCKGKLSEIPCGSASLSSADAKPACLVVSPTGNQLIASELSTNKLTVFPIGCSGALTRGTSYPSSGAGPFGSAFLKHGILLVTEAGAGALSSYAVRGKLVPVSGTVSNGQKATCWISIQHNGRIAYTSNAGSNTISIYDIEPCGTLTFRKNVKNAPNEAAAPLDSGISRDNRYFYVLNGTEGTIGVFEIMCDGDLMLKQIFDFTRLPEIGAQGLAVL